MARTIQRPVLVFPQPLSPTNPTVSPSLTWKLTSSTAFTLPRVRFKKPRRIGKYFFRFVTSSNGCVELDSTALKAVWLSSTAMGDILVLIQALAAPEVDSV